MVCTIESMFMLVTYQTEKGVDYVGRMNLYNLIFQMVFLFYGIYKMGTNVRRLQAILVPG